MEKKSLFENESDSEDNLKIKFNPDYAKSYNKLRQKELLKKLKDQDSDSYTDSDESDLSDDEETVDPKFDKEFFKTLSSLKSKDPKIYDKSTKFFEDVTNDVESEFNSKNKKTKPLTLKDYERKIILEKDGKFEDDESEDEREVNRPQSPSYAEEQKKIKAELSKVLNDSDEDNEEFGSIFKKRIKSKEEKDKENEEYIKWLAGQKEEIEDATKTSLIPLKQYWDDPKLPRNEKFLRDYVLNKGYIDTDVHEIPTYEEIVADTNLSEDEMELEKQAEFEHKYNFRFEEPDQDFIKRYPRTIENSVRRSDDSRKKKRQEAKDRKLLEKVEKMKELEMLKEMKRQEIEDKINKLREVTGNENLHFKEDELESEFDPDAHDKRMQEIFNEQYYQVDEGEEKPDCPDFEELKIEDWDNFDPNKEESEMENDDELHCEDENFNMDCEFDARSKQKLQNEMIENTRDRKKRKRRNKFMEMIKKEKPTFDANDEKTYSQYIDEYYKMDCEDFIGDIPCRFKYVECEPNDFGLTIEEILLAKNKELNQWASLKKAVQIRPSQVDKKERRLYQMKAQNETLKKKIFSSLYGEQQSDDENDVEQESKTKSNITSGNATQNCTNDVNKKKRKKKKKSKSKVDEIKNEIIELKDNKTSEGNLESRKKIKLSSETIENNNQSKIENSNKTNTNKNEKPSTVLSNSEVSKTKDFENFKDSTTIAELPKHKNRNKDKTQNQHKLKKLKEDRISKKSKNINKNKIHKNNNDGKIISDERLKAYGINPKKFNKRRNFFSKQKNKNFNKKQNDEKTKRKNPFA